MVEQKTTAQPADKTTASQSSGAVNQKKVFGKSEMLDAGNILKNMLGLSVGDMVGDLGAGGGLFTVQAARLVGDQGQVYAVDILKTALSDIDSRARMSGLHNIKTVWSNLEVVGACKINPNSLDYVLLVNVLFQSKKHLEIISEAARLIKSGGKMLIIDWDETKSAFAPTNELRVSAERLIALSQGLGFSLDQQFKAGQYHFGLIFTKDKS
ncbi:MAG: class I SAM-dependent methyltransferase [Patescibacteria group bacterium]|nr:class I SAM-dependent methyltransferase [Patescibacteria group bacterium]